MRYYVKLNNKGYPIPRTLVHHYNIPKIGRWFEVDIVEKDPSSGFCLQPPSPPSGYNQIIKHYYLVDDSCQPVTGSNISAYCPPVGHYIEYFPSCLICNVPPPPPPPLSISVYIIEPILCYGGEATLQVVAEGGYPPYTGTGVFTTLAGSVTYSVTDSHNDTVSTSIVISQPNILAIQNVTYTPIAVNGGTTSLSIVSTGGIVPYRYSLNGITYVPNPIDNVTAGNYTLYVKDANGCIASIPLDITQPPLLIPKRCTWNNVIGTGYAIDRTMGDIGAFGVPYIYQLLDFTVDGVQYATGQTLTVATVGEIVVGLGLDGNIYLMNISDWMNTIGVPGFDFHDNMRVIDTPDTSTVYTIHIRRLGPGGGPGNYFYSSQYGFSPFGPTITYGSYSCSII